MSPLSLLAFHFSPLLLYFVFSLVFFLFYALSFNLYWSFSITFFTLHFPLVFYFFILYSTPLKLYLNVSFSHFFSFSLSLSLLVYISHISLSYISLIFIHSKHFLVVSESIFVIIIQLFHPPPHPPYRGKQKIQQLRNISPFIKCRNFALKIFVQNSTVQFVQLLGEGGGGCLACILNYFHPCC